MNLKPTLRKESTESKWNIMNDVIKINMRMGEVKGKYRTFKKFQRKIEVFIPLH